MTGDRREKAQAVLFSTIMVLSVVAIGAAGFAGSAAALQEEITDDSGQPISGESGGLVVADPADPGADSVHNISVVNGTSGLGAGNVANITIVYDDSDALADINTTKDGIRDNNDIFVKIAGTNITDTGDSVSITVKNQNQIEITNLDSATDTVTLSDGDPIHVELGNENHVENPGSNTDVRTIVTEAGGNSDETTTTLEVPGAVEFYSDQRTTDGDATRNFTLIDDALANADGDDLISVGAGEYREFDTTVGAGNAIPANTTLQADGNAVLNISGNEVQINNAATSVDGFTLEGSDDSTAITDSNNPVNSTVSNNEFLNYTGPVVDLAPGDPDSDDQTVTIDSNIFSEGITGDAISLDLNDNAGGGNDKISITNNDITLSGDADAIDTTSSKSTFDLLITDENSIEGNENNVVGVDINGDIGDDLKVFDATINATDVGIDATPVSAELNISSVDITNLGQGSTDIGVQAPGSDVEIDSLTIEGTSEDPVGIDAQSNNPTSFNLSSSTITGTSNATDIDVTGLTGDEAFVTENTMSDSGTGLYLTGGGLDEDLNGHFNDFVNNTDAILVEDTFTHGDGDSLVLTFNDIVESNSNGLRVTGDIDDDSVNATYSYWGSATGPNATSDADSLSAHGNGDNVSVNNGNDADVFPFLQEETSTRFTSAQRNGNEAVLIETPAFPQATEFAGAGDTANVSVTVLNASAGVTAGDIKRAQSSSSDASAVTDPTDASGTLSPSNVATFNLSADAKGTFPVEVFVSNIDNAVGEQKFTGELDSTSVSADAEVIRAGETVNVSIQAQDADGQATERQGLNVVFSNSGFNDADVSFTNDESRTDNTGEATAQVVAGANLVPGETVDISAGIGDTNFQTIQIDTAAGAADAGESNLNVNGNPGTFTAQFNSTLDVSAQISDAAGNALEDENVTFSSNASGVSFEGEDVPTDADGFANTTVQLPTTGVGAVAINASAGGFSADTTGNARVNISTTAADASQLNVSDVSIAPGNSNPATVSVQDEFGNLNTSTPDITLNTTDQSVISINGQQEATNTSTSSGQATFTVTAESDSGSATLTASASGLTADTATASIAEVGGVSLTADDSSIINDASSDNATNFTAEVTDADGNVIQTNESIRFTRVTSSSDAAASSTGAFQVFSGDSGTVTTFRANATGTGDTTFRANIPGTSFSDTATITSTGTADGLTIEANQSTVTAGDKVQINLSVVDTGDRVVPVSRSLSVDTTLGTLDSSGATTTVSTTNGEANVTLNATEAGTASVSVANSGLQTSVSTSITVEEQEQQPTADITFDDQGVQNGSATVNIASATFNGTENFSIVVHRATDTDGDGEIEAANGEIGQKIGESEALEPGSEPKTDITVNLSEQAAADDDVEQFSETGEQTLVAMLHTTNTSDGDDILNGVSIKRNGTPVFDQATIGVSPLENPAAAQFDDDGDGEIRVDDLAEAGRTFARQEIGVQDLAAVGRAFARSQT